MTDSSPGVRIKQIDAEMLSLQKELERIKDGTDEGSSRNRAELNERMQQLKSEKNLLVKEQGTENG